MTALLVHGIFGPHESATRQHPGQFIRYCGAHRWQKATSTIRYIGCGLKSNVKVKDYVAINLVSEYYYIIYYAYTSVQSLICL